ncbi:MAG: ROK family protein [Dorea sp.]|nr:ROK family protein [Dorea sp.]
MNKYLGIDIGGTAVKIGIVDDTGNLLVSSEAPVAFDHYDTPILQTVLKESEIFLNQNNIKPDDLYGIGISATGQIDAINGIVAGSGGNIRNWEGSDLKEAFTQKYHLPVTVINDANCVALGEKWTGSAKNAKDVIVLTIGTGLGGGIIVNDQILLGQSGFGGETGHFSIHKEGVTCTCGNKGCFEQYASMTALVNSVIRYYETAEPDHMHDCPVNGKSIFDSVKKGDEAIIRIVDAWIHDIAAGIVSLVHIFNPELIIIGGGVSVQKELFIAKLRDEVMKNIMPNFRTHLDLRAAMLGNNAGIIGAVYYLIQHSVYY